MKELLAGSVALVTGGTSGIGFSIVKKFLEEGSTVIFFGTSEERGASALKELLGLNSSAKVSFLRVDVSKTDEVDKAIQEVIKQFGKIDILVNNAGITRDGLLMKMAEDDWDAVLDTNAKSCFNTSKACVRGMLKAKRGKIINISSIVGITGNSGQTNYAASKGAIISFSKALALELASRNIQVNCIAPGFIKTKMTDALTEEQKQVILSKIPLGRMGSGENIADAALFLASTLSDYMTGQVLVVDGGMVM